MKKLILAFITSLAFIFVMPVSANDHTDWLDHFDTPAVVDDDVGQEKTLTRREQRTEDMREYKVYKRMIRNQRDMLRKAGKLTPEARRSLNTKLRAHRPR